MASLILDPARAGRIGIALGSGSARGWAHIGVLRALEEAGLRPTIVSGSSVGSVVGAAYAAGKLDALEAWVRQLDRAKVATMLDPSGRGGLIKARKVLEVMTAELEHPEIDSLQCEFAAVATDLHTGREVWLRKGSLLECLRASSALPGLVTPVKIDGRWLVDGGLVNPVPVSVCRAMGADTVIAVDMNAGLLSRPTAERPTAVEAKTEVAPRDDASVPWAESLQASLGELTAELRERLLGKPTPEADTPPSIYEVMAGGIHIMQVRITRSRMAGDPPDLLIAPRLLDFGLFDFARAAEAIQAGYDATQQALATGAPQ